MKQLPPFQRPPQNIFPEVHFQPQAIPEQESAWPCTDHFGSRGCLFLECHCGIINLAGVLISCRLEKAIVFITGTRCEAKETGQSFTQLSFRKIGSKKFSHFSKPGKTPTFLEEQIRFCGLCEPCDWSSFPVCFDSWEVEEQLTSKTCTQRTNNYPGVILSSWPFLPPSSLFLITLHLFSHGIILQMFMHWCSKPIRNRDTQTFIYFPGWHNLCICTWNRKMAPIRLRAPQGQERPLSHLCLLSTNPLLCILSALIEHSLNWIWKYPQGIFGKVWKTAKNFEWLSQHFSPC